MGLYFIPRDDYLMHHGIKGQKWGVRRYQNPDGSLTPEGIKRYGHMQNFEGKSSVTKKIMNDWWDLDDDQFKGKYFISKDAYSNRVAKYGDPYRNKSGAAKFATSNVGRTTAKIGSKITGSKYNIPARAGLAIGKAIVKRRSK